MNSRSWSNKVWRERLGQSPYILLMLIVGCGREYVPPMDAARIQSTMEVDGMVFHLVDDGNAYREIEAGKKWEFHAKLYDPEEVANAYVEEEGTTYRVAPDTGKRFPIRNEIEDTFEDVEPGLPGLGTLISEERGLWGSVTLQSPAAPQVADYVALRNRLVNGTDDFLDARLEISEEQAHAGSRSLKCTSPAKSTEMITCKSSLSSPLVYVRQGDEFWYSCYLWIEDAFPLTIMDLETEFVDQHPGIRVRFYDDGVLGAELKALNKPQFRQTPGTETKCPKQQWVHLLVHLSIDAKAGTIEIYQDGKRVLNSRGPTLPFATAIYNSLEVGISAYSEEQGTSVIYIDDLRVSTAPFPEYSAITQTP